MEEVLSPLGPFPGTEAAIRYAFFAATAAWLWTEAAKSFCSAMGWGKHNKARKQAEDEPDKTALWNWGIRSLAVVLAALFGMWMAGNSWGIPIGAIGGAFNATLFPMVRDRFLSQANKTLNRLATKEGMEEAAADLAGRSETASTIKDALSDAPVFEGEEEEDSTPSVRPR